MMVFVLAAIGFLVLILLLPRLRSTVLKVSLALLIIFSILGVAVVLSWEHAVALGTGEPWWDRTPYKELMLFGLMLLGMVTDVLADHLRARIRSKEAGTKRLPKLIWEKLALPTILSVGVFLLLWQQTGAEPLRITTLLFFYQNGFFWQTVTQKWQART